MKKHTLFGILATLILLAGSGLRAADCVSLDIELTEEVMAGDLGHGSFELINCGDLAGTMVLTFALQIPNGPTIEVANIPVKLAAGETVAHSFTYPAPRPFIGHTFGICVTAQLGDASAADCASSTIIDGAGSVSDGRTDFGVALALADECLEVDLEITDVILASPIDLLAEAFFELTNCGDEDADINLRLAVKGWEFSGGSNYPVHVGAGETISRQWAFVVPPFIPDGTYVICVTATSGAALVTDCETVEVRRETADSVAGKPISDVANYPNPFNPTTQISFALKNASTVSLRIVNLLGRQVRTLVDEQAMVAGEQRVVWDGRDDAGQPVSSGIYFYRIITDYGTATEKMVLVK